MRLKTLILFSLLLLACWTRAYAQDGDDLDPEPLILGGDQGEYPLGLYLELLEDPGGELTIEDVTSPEYDTRFSPSQDKVPNFGYTDSVYWVRLNLRNDSPAIERWLLELAYANMHFVDLYTPLVNGDGFEVKQTGAMRPPSRRDILHPHIVFDLTIPNQSEQTLYIRFQNGDSMSLPLTLWEPTAFFAQSQQDQLVQGVFLGIMLGLLAYNLFLLHSIRETNYLYLVLLITGFLVFELTQSSVLEVYIIPNLYSLKLYLIVLANVVIYVSLILFNDTFFSAKTMFPKIHRINIVLVGVWAVLAFFGFFTSYHFMAIVIPPTILITLVVAAVSVLFASRQSFRPARFLLISWLGVIVGIFLFLLTRMGFISSGVISENLYRFAIAWMAISWSLALADRINQLKVDAESAGHELRDSEHRLTQTLEAMPVGVVVYGTDQRPNFINKRTTEILSNPVRGIEPDLSAGRTLAEAASYFSFRIAGSDQAYPLEEMPMHQALRGETSTIDDIEVDLVDKRIPLEIWASPVINETGNIESAVVAFQDISKRRQHEAELKKYRFHLEQLVLERTEEINSINLQLTDEMAERAVLEGLLHKRIRWMSILALARQRIKGSADLPLAYEQLTMEILQLLDAGSLFLIRWPEGVEQVEFLCRPKSQGREPDSEAIRTSFEAGSALRQELEPGEITALSADEVNSLEEPIRDCFLGSGMPSLMLTPIGAGKSSVTGVLGLALSTPKQEISRAQRELISKITSDLTGLAQEARFLDQSRALVAAEERNRLARDLHDSVTQVLFSASLVAEVLPQIWKRDPDKAMQSLEELRRLTRGALAEMRTMLLELRPAAVAKSQLAELLAQLTEASTSRVQLPFKLFIEKTPPLPEDVHAAIYRIAQEALNNVAKHARASKVTLSFRAMPLTPQQTAGKMVGVRLVIEDNGVGFSPENAEVEHLGLGIMRERAEDIEADLDINSRIGQGTRVTLDWCGVVEDSENKA